VLIGPTTEMSDSEQLTLQVDSNGSPLFDPAIVRMLYHLLTFISCQYSLKEIRFVQ